jgi:hypothetical protein
MLEKESAEPTTTMLEPPARSRRRNRQAREQREGEVRGRREGNGRMHVEEKARESAGSAGVGEEKYGRRGAGLGFTATGRR